MPQPHLDAAQQLVTYSSIIAMLGLGAFFVFFLALKDEIVPRYRSTMVTSAMICGVAAVAYFFIEQDYAASGYSQFPTLIRYMDWTITTPLLLVKYNELLRTRGYGFVATLIVADLWMIVTGLFGELHATTVNGHYTYDASDPSAATHHWIWGVVSTLGYLVILYQLMVVAPKLAVDAPVHIQRGIKSLNAYIWSLWGVYPVVYIIEGISAGNPSSNMMDACQIASSVADFLNKALFGVSAYLIVKALSTGDDLDMPPRITPQEVGVAV